MENVPLAAAVDALPTEERIEEAYALILEAVYHYYFAKEISGQLGNMNRDATGPIKAAVDAIRSAIVQQGVLSIAKTIDETTGRTSSLTHTLLALNRKLADPSLNDKDGSVQATVDLVQHVLTMTNPDRNKSLLYVRHVRNKWAGHASWDTRVDTWPTGDTALNFPLLEDALVRIVNAFEQFGILVQMSPYLQALEESATHGTVDSEGRKSFRVTISWGAMVPIANAVRFAGQQGARHLLERLGQEP